MKSFEYLKQLRAERPKNPVPPCMISISPGGVSILREMHERIGRQFDSGPYPDRMQVSNYGIDRAFRDWIFANYGAEIVKHDGKTMIRFIDEQMMLLFVLKYGA